MQKNGEKKSSNDLYIIDVINKAKTGGYILNNRGLKTMAVYLVIVLMAMTFIQFGAPMDPITLR